MTSPAPAGLEQLLRTLSAMETAFRETVRGQLLAGSRAVQIGTPDARNPLATSSGRIVGLSLRETSNTGTVLIVLSEGLEAGGPELVAVKLAAGESVRDVLPGVHFGNGLYVTVTTTGDGAVAGAVYLGGTD